MFKGFLRDIFLVSTLAFISSGIFAQDNNVGIGTITPHPSTILDVSYEDGQQSGNPAKGIGVPFANTISRNEMYADYSGNLPNGLLIYDTDLGAFMYYRWDNPIQTVPVNGQWINLSVGPQVSASNVPIGGIIMWSGTIASIDPEWALCDGTNGTPDLTDKFIISVASSAENPGTAPVNGFFVDVEAGGVISPDRRFFKLAYIIKLP
ncbi:MAG: hypothetical protein ACJAYA_001247 [Bacteroidia bacterium]|jgi:hypothetical protein